MSTNPTVRTAAARSGRLASTGTVEAAACALARSFTVS